jgi:hypothetical protein
MSGKQEHWRLDTKVKPEKNGPVLELQALFDGCYRCGHEGFSFAEELDTNGRLLLKVRLLSEAIHFTHLSLMAYAVPIPSFT